MWLQGQLLPPFLVETWQQDGVASSVTQMLKQTEAVTESGAEYVHWLFI